MKKKTLIRNLLSFALSMAMVLSVPGLAGCGETEVTETEDIELRDPAGVAKSMVNPEYRNLYKYITVSAIISPEVTEKSYSSGTNFASFAKMPGETIKKGDALVNGDTTQIDEQIKALKETIKNNEESHAEQIADMTKQLEKDKEDYEEKQKNFDFYSEIEGVVEEPFKNADGSYTFPDDPNFKGASDYDVAQYYHWSRTLAMLDSSHRYALMTYQKDQINLERTEALYELDSKYNQDRLKSLQKQRAQQVLYTDVDGTVVYVNCVKGISNYGQIRYVEKGDWLNKNMSVVAVGDLSVKLLKSQFVNRGAINTCVDYYAIIHGKRYKVEYQPMTSEEFNRISKRDGDVYSTFTIEDPDDDVKYGDLATIVIVQDQRDNVLCVPKTSVERDESGSYVYVYDGSKYVTTYVKTGMSDGMFTEILSGLSESDLVKAEYSIKSGYHNEELSRAETGADFAGTGTYFYPSTKYVINPVKHGTTYIDEVCVKKNMRVEKGDVLIRVHVVSDAIEIEREERQIERLNEQLADLIKENDEDDKNGKQIKNVRKQIEEATEHLNELKSDAAVTAVRADRSGIITEMFDGGERNPGDLMRSEGNIAKIADQSSCFIAVDDSNQQLSYGNSVVVSYEDRNNNVTQVKGTVVTANAMSMSRTLRQGLALVSVAPEDMGTLLETTNAANAGIWDITRFSVYGKIRVMDDVLMVPRKAVTEFGGNCYVTVKEADGTLKNVSFICGGSDTNGYWVAEGLTEGMTICWE
ncbi:MAG: efflux RND transporter periplasmic adaptor subunit [Lachnospiraceae bacterium]|nr:efflux RND transporter periplasmic adaptor subunit [Lachnospiraceae bacterium]